MDYDAYDAILHHIFKQTQGDAWFKPDADNMACGVGLRVQPGIFRVFPYSNPLLEPFATALVSLNPEVAVKIRSAAIHAAFATVPESQDHFFIDTNTRIQVLDSIDDLSNAEKEQRAAFIRDERCLVVWEERVSNIIPSCADFEDRLVKLVWRERERVNNHGSLNGDSPASTSAACLPSDESVSRLPQPPAPPNSPFACSPSSISRGSFAPTYGNIPPPEIVEKFTAESVNDIEKSTISESGALVTRRNRPTRIYANIYIGLATALAAIFVGNGISIIMREFLLDGNFMRFILLVTSPLIFCVSLFFAIQIVNSLTFCFGPVAHYRENSKYFSAVAPGPLAGRIEKLPHVTVQMPVYKESCKATITPSINSIKEAMVTYARQGGTSSIFICDDGLQLIDDTEREERLKLYDESNIGWVARPKHSNEPGGFIRAGRFKKASNLNYGLALSLRVEQLIAELEANPSAYADIPPANTTSPSAMFSNPNSHSNPYTNANIHVADLNSNPNLSRCRSGSTTPNQTPNGSITIEERALGLAVAETGGQAWASGARSLRIGEIILLVDSDTMVPDDCFRDAARELAQSPEVAIIQHESDVMQVAHHWFENGLAYFTRRINHCISAACANGEVSPFVGHNAFLRWSAIQDAAFTDSDGKPKFWSEEHVSEDFDMSLRLQIKGYVIRWATYSLGGFKEGVSLTCDDELNRWMKYAYGCSELLFNPFVRWYRGPVTRQISRFVWSSVPLHYKISVLSYMFSYYGIAGAFTLTLMNYLLLGFSFPVDGYYMRSWEMWLAVTVVFVGAGNLGMTMLDYRVYGKNLISSFLGNIKWIPYFFFFFGGLSLHLSGAILAHMFNYNMTWSATKKEVEASNFFKEFPRILKRFWLSLTICFIIVGAMAVLSTPLIPDGWRISGTSWAVIFPLAIQVGCHILFPLVLNPWLMIFSY